MRLPGVAALMLLTAVTAARAATYYVAPDGSDGGGGSTEAPWETLQHAAEVVGPGDRVVVRPGDYAGFHLTTSGAAGAPIEFVAEPGVRVTAPNPVTPDGINLEGPSHVVIDGFDVVGMPRAGVRTVGPYSGGDQSFAEFVTIRNVTARDNDQWGVLTGFVHDLLIEDNRTSGSIEEHGIYVGNSGDRPVIRRNEVWGNHANGIHVNADASVGLDGVIEEAVIVQNTIYDNGEAGGSGVNMDGVINSRIENNLIYGNHASGISLYQIDGAAPSTGNVVAHNTIHQASDGRWAVNLQNGATDNTVANNILLSEHSFRGAIDVSPDSLAGLTSDYNVVIPRFTTNDAASVLTLSEWRDQTGQDMNSFVADVGELFVDAEAGDYRLRAGSPAVDAGWGEWAADEDVRGAARPMGAGVDIGAYERLVGASESGDFNDDGVVDAADYSLWRDTLGDSVASPFEGADGDGDGVVGEEDYTVWRQAVLQSPPSDPPMPAPEAAGVLLAGASLGLLGVMGRRSMRRRPAGEYRSIV